MDKIEMIKEAPVDVGYEFYQTIIDFDNPIQIFREAFQNSVDENATKVYCHVFIEKSLGQEDLYIDIWDNGGGLTKENIDCFFGLAKSTKIDKNKTPIAGKLGYKGHGTKIFFKSERVEICSKTLNGEAWGAVADEPIKQIREKGKFKYSDFLKPDELQIKLPNEFDSGFYVRIKNPAYFKTQNTRYMLNHMYLRDYSKWYTVFGNIRQVFVKTEQDRYLFLQGLNINHFENCYKSINEIDPPPEFATEENIRFEKLRMGHYFPEQRFKEREMEKYAKSVGLNKAYSDYYSKEIFKEKVYLDINLCFDFILYVEGYETKRRYDILLSKRGPSSIDKTLLHTDAERYGLWACKGGVPIEKIDDWIVGGRGIGTYTYMHGFVDCDAFELTGTRSSIRNTDLEILEKIKQKINSILGNPKVLDDLTERQEWEDHFRTLRTINEDEQELKKRYKESQNKRNIELPNGKTLQEPIKTKSGYSESETLILLVQIIKDFPDLFPFKFLDYNTTKGIDFVVQKSGNPAYIELKGTMQSKVNHSFRNIYKFICYDIDLRDGDILSDVENLQVGLKINKDDHFPSFDDNFKDKKYTSYQLQPISAVIQSMEIIVLKKVLSEVIGAKFD